MTDDERKRLIYHLTEKLAQRLPAVIQRNDGKGRQIVIHISPDGRRLRIEWPPAVDDIEL